MCVCVCGKRAGKKTNFNSRYYNESVYITLQWSEIKWKWRLCCTTCRVGAILSVFIILKRQYTFGKTATLQGSKSLFKWVYLNGKGIAPGGDGVLETRLSHLEIYSPYQHRQHTDHLAWILVAKAHKGIISILWRWYDFTNLRPHLFDLAFR